MNRHYENLRLVLYSFGVVLVIWVVSQAIVFTWAYLKFVVLFSVFVLLAEFSVFRWGFRRYQVQALSFAVFIILIFTFSHSLSSIVSALLLVVLLFIGFVIAIEYVLFRFRYRRLYVSIAGYGVFVLCSILYLSNATYERSWSNGSFHYRDTYRLISGRWMHRRIFCTDETSRIIWTKGPIAGTGKPHGEWTTLTDSGIEYQFFWYGEEITEGEWHLRNPE